MLFLTLGIPGRVDFLVLAESSSRNKGLCTRRASEWSVAAMQSPVQLVARLVRKRLMADIADEAFCR